MMLRQHWGKAGAALMGTAVIAVLAELTALTTTDRSHVPLWPLAIIAALFIFGCILFACRIRERTANVTPSYPDREFADKDPKEIMEIVKRNTAIQSHKLLEPYQGKWLRATGPLRDVSPWDSYSKASQVNLNNYSLDVFVAFWFNDEGVVQGRLSLLDIGTKVTIVGQIENIGPFGIWLKKCELEKVFAKEETSS